MCAPGLNVMISVDSCVWTLGLQLMLSGRWYLTRGSDPWGMRLRILSFSFAGSTFCPLCFLSLHDIKSSGQRTLLVSSSFPSTTDRFLAVWCALWGDSLETPSRNQQEARVQCGESGSSLWLRMRVWLIGSCRSRDSSKTTASATVTSVWVTTHTRYNSRAFVQDLQVAARL